MILKKVIVALDSSNLKSTLNIVSLLKNEVFAFKIGYEFFLNFGLDGYKKIKKICPKIFLDLKLHDIPNTVQAATASAGNIGADYLTIHIASEKEALLAASENKTENIKLLGVSSALTSKAMDEETSKIVEKDFIVAKESGIDGVICPASEILKTKQLFDLIVTPGIRLEDDNKDDQKNVTTPEKAIEMGSKYIVMGRSIRNNIDYIINSLDI